MSDFQKTIKQEVYLKGIGLHTGSSVEIRLKPAAENAGITFIRMDLPEHPLIKVEPASIDFDDIVPRCTALGKGDSKIYTVEHFLSALHALGIDNLIVEIKGNELPGLDGSALEFLQAIKKAGIQEQKEPKKVFYIKEPVGVELNGASVYIFPSKEFKVSYTLDYSHPFLKTQFHSLSMTAESFEKEIAPSRTFCLESEAKQILENGLGKGANHKNTLVVGENGVVDNQLRFPNEFPRHKILDCVGDLYLLGMTIRGHVFAVKSGHTLNLHLLRLIDQQKKKYESKGQVSSFDCSGKDTYLIEDIMKIIPHRYPFLFVDRVTVTEPGKKAVGIKNVTMNDYFFQGHFPAKPIMPGVIMVEAMAQAAGVLVLTSEAHRGNLALFMAVDQVKFRRVVSPGDQLVMEVEIVRDRAKTAHIKALSKVGDEVVCEADLVFSFTDASYLG